MNKLARPLYAWIYARISLAGCDSKLTMADLCKTNQILKNTLLNHHSKGSLWMMLQNVCFLHYTFLFVYAECERRAIQAANGHAFLTHDNSSIALSLKMSQVVKTNLMNFSNKMLISMIFIPKPPRYSGGVPRYMVFYPTHDEPLHILSYIDPVGHSYGPQRPYKALQGCIRPLRAA